MKNFVNIYFSYISEYSRIKLARFIITKNVYQKLM